LEPEPPPLPDGEQGSSAAFVELRPSLTAMVQPAEVKVELVRLKVPSLAAVPSRVPFTVMDAPPRAPLPLTERVVPTSDADETAIAEEPPLLDGPEGSRVAVGVTSPPHARASSTRDSGKSRCILTSF
jgi:hypothetical protein